MQTGDIICFKTLVGEVIGEVDLDASPAGKVKLRKALGIHYAQREDGSWEMGFVPLVVNPKNTEVGEVDIELNYSAVAFNFEPHPDLETKYTEIVSSIQIATQIPKGR